MFKPFLAIVATMCLSWGIALAVHAVRNSTDADIVIECRQCHTHQVVAPSPVSICKHCGLVQFSRRFVFQRAAMESD